MRVIFDDEALDDLQDIFNWIAKDNRRAAEKSSHGYSIRLSASQFRGSPTWDVLGLDPGTRELIEYPYIIVYEVYEDRGHIVVLSIVHGAKDREGKGV